MVPECFIGAFSGTFRADDRSQSYITYGLVTLFTFKLAAVSPCFLLSPGMTGLTTGGVPSASTSLFESPHSLLFSDLVSSVLLIKWPVPCCPAGTCREIRMVVDSVDHLKVHRHVKGLG